MFVLRVEASGHYKISLTMNSNKRAYIARTDYFNDPWTWAKRTFVFLFLIGVTIYWEWTHEGVLLWKYFVVPVCTIFIYLNPRDDLAIDDKYFYHLRRSLLSIFNTVKKYEIDRMKYAKCSGIFSPNFEFIHLLGYGHSNSIEISFDDDSSITLNVLIYKEELISLLGKVNEIIKRKELTK